jgi:transposase
MRKLAVVEMQSQQRNGAKERGGGEQRPAAGSVVTIGVDLSRSKWVYAVRWGGQDRRRLTTPGRIEHFQALVREYAGCRVQVVYEACGFGFEIAWWCQEQEDVDIMVIAPSRVERAPGPQVKTDKVDARKMALKREQGQLKGIYIPNRQEHERRQLARTYGQMRKDTKRYKTRIRMLMQEHGRLGPLPKAGWKAYSEWLSGQELPSPVAFCVKQLLLQFEMANVSVQRVKGELLALIKLPQYQPVIKALITQRGVGEFAAIVLVLELGDVRRFATAGSLPHYLGLTPSEYSTGDDVHRGHILKCGPGPLRALLVQCAWAAVSKAKGKPDPELRQVFDRLAPHIDRKPAIVAVARRMSVRLRARWLEVLAQQHKGREVAA